MSVVGRLQLIRVHATTIIIIIIIIIIINLFII